MDIVTLQEEFETLVSELQHLKNVNEVLTSNSKQAEAAIEASKTALEKIGALVSSMEEDRRQQKVVFEQQTASLESTQVTLKTTLNEGINELADQERKSKLATADILQTKLEAFASSLSAFQHSIAAQKEFILSMETRISEEIDANATKYEDQRTKGQTELTAIVNAMKTSLDDQINKLTNDLTNGLLANSNELKKISAKHDNTNTLLEDLKREMPVQLLNLEENLLSSEKMIKTYQLILLGAAIVGIVLEIINLAT